MKENEQTDQNKVMNQTKINTRPSGYQTNEQRAEKPNVLLILTDDQRFDTIEALSFSHMITPNFNRLVSRGTTFTQAHIPSGTSGAICMPSRAMLLTGRTLFHLEGEGQSIPPEHVQIGQVFSEAGYDTYGTGKWHNGTDAFNRGFKSGDHIFFGGMWDHWNVPCCDYDPSGRYNNLTPFIDNFFYSREPKYFNCDQIHPGYHSSEMLADATIDFLDCQPDDQPFFAYTSFLAPHDPRSMPKAYLDLYDPDHIKLPENFYQTHPFDLGVHNIRDEQLVDWPLDPEEVKQHIREYYAMISHLDAQIGRILDKLKDQNQLEKTIIVIAGDNGLSVGQHGLMGKQNHYEHSIRVPLIMSGPGIAANKRVDDFVYLLDIFPTLCDLCQLPVPSTVDGISMASVLKQNHSVRDNISSENVTNQQKKKQQTASRDSLYFAFTDLIRSVKTRQYKLTEACGPDRKTLLFDLEKDPLEMENLAEKANFQETVRELRQLLISHRDEWDDLKHPMGQAFWQRYEATTPAR